MSDFRLPKPNVFGCFEATVGVLGASVVLLGVFLLCAFKLPCKDAAKPFFLVLAISMIVSVAGSITLLIFSESMEIASTAYTVQMYPRFISFMSLLFGGGFHLLSSINAARTGNGSSGCAAWFIHLAVALAALAVLLGNRAYILQNSFLLLGYCLPLMGLIFLLASFAIVSLHLGYQVEQLVSSFCVVSLSLLMPGCRLADRSNDSESKEDKPAKTGFTRLALSFAAPAVIIAITRGEEGVTLLIRVISNISRGSSSSYDRFGILDAISKMAWNRPIPDALELFLPIAIVLSAVLFHPSMRGLFCRSGDKAKIVPVAEEGAPSSTAAVPQQPIMMSPMMATPQQMMVPQPNMTSYNNQMLLPSTASQLLNSTIPMTAHTHMLPQTQISAMPTTPQAMSPPHPLPSTQTLHQYPSTIHGMGGRPMYIMA
ncbi:hypothetical protein PRIPAC_81563 [Pristionchus pacificus]|uniref:Uncharacterized protein n=1 Tax=Pristionchus pacificus TaxID=54126 RepID=A0A2A6CKS9_PRIPA|nr:hypothetical protein PRIPAC_81563 [Pristionchus pacificus]|eukprot:PDM78835.1 hypothetical protein PRIPAC_31414 [Pristionchus pacificus]